VRHPCSRRSAFEEYEPKATELSSCAPISAHRQLRKDSGGSGGGVARRARTSRAPNGQVLSRVLRHVLRRVLCRVLCRVLRHVL